MGDGNKYNEGVWEEIMRLRRSIAELRAAIRTLNERVDMIHGAMLSMSNEQQQFIGQLISGKDE